MPLLDGIVIWENFSQMNLCAGTPRCMEGLVFFLWNNFKTFDILFLLVLSLRKIQLTDTLKGYMLHYRSKLQDDRYEPNLSIRDNLSYGFVTLSSNTFVWFFVTNFFFLRTFFLVALNHSPFIGVELQVLDNRIHLSPQYNPED